MKLFSLLLFTSALWGQSLTKIETSVINTVKQQMPQTEALLEKTVNINSGTLNKEGVRAVGNLMAAELEKLGFKTE